MRLFERMLRGRTESFEAPSTELETQIATEVNSLKSIPSEQKAEVEALATELHKGNQDNGDSSSNTTIPVAVAVAAAFVAMKPNEAQAGITGRLVSQFTSMLSPLLSSSFTEIFNSMLSGWFDTTEGTSTANIVAVASMADGVNQVKTTTHNQTILASAEPDPQSCELDSASNDEMEATATEQIRTVNTTIALDMSSQEQDGNARGTDFRAQIERAQSHEKGAASIIDTEILFSQVGYDTEEEASLAFDVSKNIAGADKQAPKKHIVETLRKIGVSTPTADGMDVERATSMSRRSIANYIVAEQSTRRNNLRSGGSTYRSSARIDMDEISRTYTGAPTHAGSGAGYAGQMNEFAHPAPLMRQMNFQQARTNSLLVQELEEVMKSNVLSGVQLMELVDRRGKI